MGNIGSEKSGISLVCIRWSALGGSIKTNESFWSCLIFPMHGKHELTVSITIGYLSGHILGPS